MTGLSSEPDDRGPGKHASRDAWCRITSEPVARRAPSLIPNAAPPSPPFFTQHGQQLLLLDEGAAGWVMAEFFFDADQCRYVELRRACYDWPREAAGALLSRTLPAGADALAQTAAELLRWVDLHGPDAESEP